jgi:hypothetical protein
VEDLSHPAWQWDEQAVQSTNQRMEGLAINALLVQLYQPELLTTGPAAKVPSGKGFSAGTADDSGAVTPQGPVWIGKDFRLGRTPGPHQKCQRLVPAAAAPLAGPTGAGAIGTPCCMARSVRAGGCSGSSRCTWGSAELQRVAGV